MDLMIAILGYLLVILAVAPLLMLALYLLADRFCPPLAGRLLDGTARLLALQWLAGALVQVVVGLALAALGGWLAWRAHEGWHPLIGGCLVAFGGWRAIRGAVLLLQLRGRR